MPNTPAPANVLTAAEVRRRYESMVALGTAAHSPDAWSTMAELLEDAAHQAASECLVLNDSFFALADRALDCRQRAIRSAAQRECTAEDHDNIKSDPVRFNALPLRGYQPTYNDEPGAPQQLELRNCTDCNSTLCREVA